MPTGNICSSTRRLFVPTRIPPAPKKAGHQEIGCSRGGEGGLTTKRHVAVDALGHPLRVILSAGQIADIEQAAALIKDQPAGFIVADKGYDSDAFVTAITAQGSQAGIPPRSNRLNPRSFGRHLYKVAIWSNASLLVSSISDVALRATIHSPRPSCPSFISPMLSSAWLG